LSIRKPLPRFTPPLSKTLFPLPSPLWGKSRRGRGFGEAPGVRLFFKSVASCVNC
jgi:hypothetical protein